jgi:hypothetical protein
MCPCDPCHGPVHCIETKLQPASAVLSDGEHAEEHYGRRLSPRALQTVIVAVGIAAIVQLVT